MIVFVDTSALGSVYLGDERVGGWMAEVIFNGPDPVVICELADVEFASLLARARNDGRIDEHAMAERLNAYRDHTGDDGPIGVVPLSGQTVNRAQQFVFEGHLRTLDALHLAAAQLLSETSNDEVQLLTRDDRQARMAESLGIALVTDPEDRP